MPALFVVIDGTHRRRSGGVRVDQGDGRRVRPEDGSDRSQDRVKERVRRLTSEAGPRKVHQGVGRGGERRGRAEDLLVARLLGLVTARALGQDPQPPLKRFSVAGARTLATWPPRCH